MGVISRQPLELASVEQKLRASTNLPEIVELLQKRGDLVASVQKDLEEVHRAARGWVYAPPS